MSTSDRVAGASESGALRLLPTTATRRQRVRRPSNGASSLAGAHGPADAWMPDGQREPEALGRTRSVRIAISIQEEVLRREVLDFLGRCPGVDLAGSLSTPEVLANFTDETSPRIFVICPQTAARAPDRTTSSFSTLLVVTPEVTVQVLRDAIRAGAHGVFEWPNDRAGLVEAVGRIAATEASPRTDRGAVVAVAGARGGAGATFVASHLAAVFADRGLRPVLVDADPRHADLTAALGITPEEDARTVQDLVPVIPELSPEHVEDALYLHAGGFRVLLGPREPDPEVRLGLYRGVIALLAFTYDPVVVHVARAHEASARAITDLADVVLLVTTLDLFSLYGAKRIIGALGLGDGPERCVVVVNRSGPSPIGPKDVQRVLGMPPGVRIRSDRRIRRMQDRGRLLPVRSGGAGRDIRRLANLLLRLQPTASASGQP